MNRKEYAREFAHRLQAANKAREAATTLMSDGQVSPDAAAIAFSNMYLAGVVGLVVAELAHYRVKDGEK